MTCDPGLIACQLERIANAISGFDWNTLVATFIATVAGALVAALVGLAVARADKPQPVFRVRAITPEAAWRPNRDGIAVVGVELWNIGDGPAYNVRLTPTGDESSVTEESPVLPPGAVLKARLYVKAAGTLTYDATADVATDDRKVEWPSHATAHVEWQQPPRRTCTRRVILGLRSPFEVETLQRR
ncbi:hypothetical protein [Microbacterium aurantiacum]|uniref:Uncharacterized protein n=1 Tax=Microbacterium aurantiacum TaxID=162393 RepID=A0A0M8MLT6_9MICO|nr:hypothetical protein [Microbacterium chocolatum]ANG85774.1 hypothetical protein A8L33_10570 [Microbacterium chocolatum]KOS10074.1 hypothetical protein XI38_12525 [Microbacterium chocolatum]